MFIAGLSVSGLVACGGNEGSEPETDGGNTGTGEETGGETAEGTEGEETSGEKTVIKLWLDDDAWAEAMVPAIEEALPHIDIEFEKVGAVDARAKLELDGPAGLGADIFIQPHDGMSPAIEAQILLPLGDEMETMVADRFLEGSVATVQSGDAMYGVPLLTESLAFFYNKTLLEENGLEVATSFEEIAEQAATFNDPANNKFIFRFQAGNAYDNHFFLTANGFQLFGEDHLDGSKVNYDTDEFVAGLEAFSTIKDILPVPAADLNYDTVTVPFSKGEFPYTINGPWAIAEMKAGAEENGFEFGITTIPTINGVQPETFSGNIIACISAYTKEADAAREVVDFLASEEGLKLTFDVTGKIPALKDNSVIEGVMEDPYVAGILAQAAHSQPMPIIPEMNTYWGPTETALKSVWDELATPEEAAAKAMEDFIAAGTMTE